MHYFYKRRILYLLIFLLSLFTLWQVSFKQEIVFEFIPLESIKENLHKELSTRFLHNVSTACNYDKLIYSETISDRRLLYNSESNWKDMIPMDRDIFMFHGVERSGGEFYPHCRPKFSTAIIVTFRRSSNFQVFLAYMSGFLKMQEIHYRIYAIEQVNSKSINRAKLLNVGALEAMRDGFPCLIFHDSDIVPTKLANIYACTKAPRLMSTILMTSWFYSSYQAILSGAIAIKSIQFRSINGMSNTYSGEGYDDLFGRLEVRNYKLCAFDTDISEYQLVSEDIPPTVREKKERAMVDVESMTNDGLSTLKYTKIGYHKHRLFTHILVEFVDDSLRNK